MVLFSMLERRLVPMGQGPQPEPPPTFAMEEASYVSIRISE